MGYWYPQTASYPAAAAATNAAAAQMQASQFMQQTGYSASPFGHQYVHTPKNPIDLQRNKYLLRWFWKTLSRLKWNSSTCGIVLLINFLKQSVNRNPQKSNLP
ncbi:hypothetical protein FOCC_FOCC012583 [Frankliniella occidentalis]|nr:hypothetical protein FOCC_FOCC012583 [Frankliniella occidentalis]